MYQFMNHILDFLLPAFCPHCRIKLKSGEKYICASCMARISYAGSERIKEEFGRKFREREYISEFTAGFIFEKDGELQSMIHALKYDNKFLTGVFLGETIARNNRKFFSPARIDLITPVPLHRLKKAERGYNQAFYIAKGISKEADIPLSGRALKRIKFTQTQTSLSLDEREKNVRDAFKIRRKHGLKGKNILIVDDVITTGATTNECARVLLNAGAGKVIAASVALAD